MTIRIIFLVILGITGGNLYSQGWQPGRLDQIAVFYLACKDLAAENRISSRYLEQHLNGPIKDYWDEISSGKYKYEVTVFGPIELDFTEAEFTPEVNTTLVGHLKKKLDAEGKNLSIPPTGGTVFDPDNFDKIIYLIGENSLGSVSGFEGSYIKEDFKITLNNQLVQKPTLSIRAIRKDTEGEIHFYDDTFKNGQDPVVAKKEGIPLDPDPTNLPENYGLWGRPSQTLLHEWGHSLGINHANMPWANKDLQRYYSSIGEGYYDMNLNVNGKNKSFDESGNGFDLMGGYVFSLGLNSAMLDMAGFLSEENKTTISETTENIELTPLYQKPVRKNRAAIIKIKDKRPTPLIKIENTGSNSGDFPYVDFGKDEEQWPTAMIDLYVEYRTAVGYDKNLGTKNLAVNTKGLMINLRFNEVKINPRPEIDDVEYWKDFNQNHTLLLDMTPQDGRANVTLNPGWEFYQKDWEISIQNVRKEGERMFFDVEYGKKENLVSNVYKTILFPGESVESFDQPILYSSSLDYRLELIEGELKVIDNVKNKSVWRGREIGIPVDATINKLEITGKELVLSSNAGEVWRGNNDKLLNSKLIISDAGELSIGNTKTLLASIDNLIAIRQAGDAQILDAKLTKSYTKEAWVYLTPTYRKTNNIISGGSTSQHAFFIPSNYGYRLAAGHNGKWDYVKAPQPFPCGWHHVAVTYDEPNKMMNLYQDGKLVATNSKVPPIENPDGFMQVGMYDQLYHMAGEMKKIMVWDYALTADEISSSFQKANIDKSENVALCCTNSPTRSQATVMGNNDQIIKLRMDWNEGSGFNGKNLIIANGECINCPQLGGIDRRFPRTANYEIRKNSSPVIIKWSNERYCGNGSITIE